MSERITNRCRIGRVVDVLSYVPIKRLRLGFPPMEAMIQSARLYVREGREHNILPPEDLLNDYAGASAPFEWLLSGLHLDWRLSMKQLRGIVEGPLHFLAIPIDDIQATWGRLDFLGAHLLPRDSHRTAFIQHRQDFPVQPDPLPPWGGDVVEWLLQNSLPMPEELAEVVTAVTTMWDLDQKLAKETLYKEWKDAKEKERADLAAVASAGDGGASDAVGARVDNAQVSDSGDAERRAG